MSAQAAALSRLANLTSEVVKIQVHDVGASMEDVHAAYADMNRKYPEEYVMYSLASAALPQVGPWDAASVGYQPHTNGQHGQSSGGAWVMHALWVTTVRGVPALSAQTCLSFKIVYANLTAYQWQACLRFRW